MDAQAEMMLCSLQALFLSLLLHLHPGVSADGGGTNMSPDSASSGGLHPTL